MDKNLSINKDWKKNPTFEVLLEELKFGQLLHTCKKIRGGRGGTNMKQEEQK
jgi:hypothetical protein